MNLFKKLPPKSNKPFHCSIDKASCHEFVSFNAAEAWGMNRYSPWAKTYKKVFSLSTARYQEHSPLRLEEPIELYCGYNYRETNDYLRNNIMPSAFPKVSFFAATLVTAILSAPTTDQNLVAYRQVSLSTIQAIMEARKNETIYCEKGFLSVSLHKETCFENCGHELHVLKIYIPKDVPAVYVNAIVRRDEAELLLPPEMFLRLVADPYLDSSGKRIYEVELLDMIAYR